MTTLALIDLLQRPVGAADRARAALHVLDWIGCAAAGACTPPGVAMRAFAATLPAGACRTVGGTSLASRDAALVNGALGNVLEMDDFHRTALVHPGPVVVPAALAAAAETGANGTAVLDAIVRGFEAMIRIGRSVGPAHYRQFHNTATCGAFGAAAAVGSLLALDRSRLADALGNAGTQAAGLWQCRLEDTMSKQLHNGHAAQAGMLAAQLAAHGFTGAHAILEGELGFFAGLCPDALPERLLEHPDARWSIHETSFKPWPACRHTHPVIDAALALREQVDAADIQRIHVSSYRDAVKICDNLSPGTPVQAKFSLQQAAAVILLRGRPVLADFDMEAVGDPAVTALRALVTLHEDTAMTQAYPARFGARVEIHTRDGRRLSHQVVDALGDPEIPLSEDALIAKARMLLGAAAYPNDAIEQVIAGSLGLPGAADTTTLLSLLR